MPVTRYDPALYCKVFVDTRANVESLVQLVAHSVEGIIDGNTILAADSEIDVRRNDHQDGAGPDIQGDFMRYTYYLDVVPTIHVNQQTQIALVTRLINAFWQRGFPAVAACDFEDELPRHGGYSGLSLQ